MALVKLSTEMLRNALFIRFHSVSHSQGSFGDASPSKSIQLTVHITFRLEFFCCFFCPQKIIPKTISINLSELQTTVRLTHACVESTNGKSCSKSIVLLNMLFDACTQHWLDTNNKRNEKKTTAAPSSDEEDVRRAEPNVNDDESNT